MMFVNSDNDPIFPMDANDRISNRLERLYSLYGASDVFDSFVSVGGHAYREDLRRGIYRFLNTHLKGDGRTVLDSEVMRWRSPQRKISFLSRSSNCGSFRRMRIFQRIKQTPPSTKRLCPRAAPETVTKEAYSAWRERKLAELRALPFRQIPTQVEPAVLVGGRLGNTIELRTDDRLFVSCGSCKRKRIGSRRACCERSQWNWF